MSSPKESTGLAVGSDKRRIISIAKSRLDDVLRVDSECRYKGISDDLHTLPLEEDLTEIWRESPPLPTIYPDWVKKSYYYGNRRCNLDLGEGGFCPLPVSNEEFRERFYECYPFFKGLSFDNILVAGGAISRLLKYSRNEMKEGGGFRGRIRGYYDGIYQEGIDLDIFFYGIDEDQALDKIHYIHDHLQKACEINNSFNTFYYSISKYVLNIFFTVQSGQHVFGDKQEIQIIFRLYKSKSEILHGFDLGSCAVGFDGDEVLFTSLSRFSYTYGVNVIDTTRRSTSYEWRLSKYLSRGFGIVFPQLDLDTVKQIYFGRRTKLEKEGQMPKGSNFGFGIRFTFREDKFHLKLFLPYAMMTISAIEGNRILGDFELRFSGKYNIMRSDYGEDNNQTNHYSGHYHQNYIQNELPKRNTKFLMNGELDRMMRIGDKFNEIIQYKIDAGPILNHVEEEHSKLLNRMRSLNLPDTVNTLQQELEKRRVFIKESLSGDGKKIEWIKENPGTQLTSSINPIIEDEWMWYGLQFYKPNPHLRQMIIIGALNGHPDNIRDVMIFWSNYRHTIANKMIENSNLRYPNLQQFGK